MVVVMAKVPLPGRCKTRLIPALGAEGAAGLAAAMAEDVFTTVEASRLPWRVAISGALDNPWVDQLRAPVESQAEGDLGTRLAAALPRGGIAVGTDCPLLPAALLLEAERSRVDLFCAASDDGGYVLVKANARAVELGVFEGVAWSTRETLRSQLDRGAALGLRCGVVHGYYDIDEPADLTRLRAEPALPAHTRAFLEAR